ncbi:MAG: hypothetical protein ACLP0J_14070 [Solirubrobacteraceae bacterium]
MTRWAPASKRTRVSLSSPSGRDSPAHAGVQMLADFARVLGPAHPDTLATRRALAGAYRAAGRLEEAAAVEEGRDAGGDA